MAKLHLATRDDMDKLLPMVTGFHTDEGIEMTEERRRSVLQPLLDGIPNGAVYLIGLRRAPVGYIALAFGYSIELGGYDGFVDEFWIRPAVRGRGMGTEAIAALAPVLRDAGITALHLEVGRQNPAAALYKRLGFEMRDGYSLMTCRLG